MSKKIKKDKKTFSPVLILSVFILLIVLSSAIMSFLNVEGTRTTIAKGTLETSIVVVNNVLSKEGIVHFLSNLVTNFQLLQPLVLIILSLMAIGVARGSGLLKHLFQPLRKLQPSAVTFLVIIVGIIASFIGEYSYIILIPLVAVLYQYLNRNAILGIITVFLGITLGYGTGLFYNYDDYVLGTLTQAAAVIDVDQTYRYTLYSNIYIMFASTVILSFFLTILIHKYLTPKFEPKHYEDELNTSNKALICSLVTVIILLIGLGLMVLPATGGILLDQNQPLFVAKLFSDTAPFKSSFICLFLGIVTIVSLVYGIISKNFKNSHEFGLSFTKEFDKIGYLFVMLFLITIINGLLDWTNIGVVVTTNLTNLLVTLNFSGIALLILSFILIILMSILMPSSFEKWALISPLLVPLFMRANMTPDFAQFVFETADCVGKAITPIFIFYIVMQGFIAKYDDNVSIFKTYKAIIPIILLTAALWLIIIVCWYIVGLPLGVGTAITM